MNNRINVWFWAVIAWIGVIFFSSTSLASQWAEHLFSAIAAIFLSGLDRNSSSYGAFHVLSDKGLHVSLFCILAILLWRALPNSPRKLWMIVLTGAIVGSCSEFLQRFFPDRDPAIRDVLINIGGTVLGILLCLSFARLRFATRRIAWNNQRRARFSRRSP